MNRREQIFFHHFLADHNGILEVVPLPWHEGHFQVTTQCQFAIFGCISFCQEVAVNHFLPFGDRRAQVDAGFLVRTNELGQFIDGQVVFKADEFILLAAFVAYMDLVSVNIFNHTVAGSMDLNPCITGGFGFEAGTHDGHFGLQQRNGLALHV